MSLYPSLHHLIDEHDSGNSVYIIFSEKSLNSIIHRPSLDTVFDLLSISAKSFIIRIY
jgi:hypothetical protein